MTTHKAWGCSPEWRVHRPITFLLHHIYLFHNPLKQSTFEKPSPLVQFYAADAPFVIHVRKYFPSTNTNTSIMYMQVNSCSSIMPSLLWLILITSTLACRSEAFPCSFVPLVRIAQMLWKDACFSSSHLIIICAGHVMLTASGVEYKVADGGIVRAAWLDQCLRSFHELECGWVVKVKACWG